MVFRKWVVIARARGDNPEIGAADLFVEEVNKHPRNFFLKSSAIAWAANRNDLFHPIAKFSVMDRRHGNQ